MLLIPYVRIDKISMKFCHILWKMVSGKTKKDVKVSDFFSPGLPFMFDLTLSTV